MINGYSDAQVRVVKRGPNCREQAMLCGVLGKEVAPIIHKVLDDGYEMEMLVPLPERDLAGLVQVYRLLVSHVWVRPATVGDLQTDWLHLMYTWASQHDTLWLLKPLTRLYPAPPVNEYRLIHGDPTLANAMIRPTTQQIILTDPMGRYDYRREIPNLIEVDIGKMIQSAGGWEHRLGMERSVFDREVELIDRLPLIGMGEGIVAKSLLWAAIHLARVAIRARVKGHTAIDAWATTKSLWMVKQ